MKKIMYGMALLGLGMLLGSAFMIRNNMMFYKAAVTVQGRIVDINRTSVAGSSRASTAPSCNSSTGKAQKSSSFRRQAAGNTGDAN
ncbi:MAG: hypothetical protein V4631_07995 [Pseudomonadota bacterium]